MRLKTVLLLVILGSIVFLVYRWDRSAPILAWSQTGGLVGGSSSLRIDIFDEGNGLHHVSVAIQQGERVLTVRDELFAQEEPKFRSGVEFEVGALGAGSRLEDGPFDVIVRVSDRSNFGVSVRTTAETHRFTLDTRPPLLSILSSGHFIRQGGSQLIEFSVQGEEAVESGIQVDQAAFGAFPHPSKPGVSIALIGLPYNHAQETPLVVWAADAVGNRAQLEVPYRIIPVRYRQRALTITDRFIQKVSAEILPRTPDVEAGQSPEETFVRINDGLRRKNHQQITQISGASAEKLLFDRPFVQLVNSKVEAGFADQRDYLYSGRVIDRQTHMGFDLASNARSDVNSANDGRVLWADYLGIYGNCVIVDHGLGLLSLYGHLSSIAVEVNQEVERGQSLGKTGATGLAGGDHLHFTTLIQGVQVNPIEWWDPKWVREQVFERLQETP